MPMDSDDGDVNNVDSSELSSTSSTVSSIFGSSDVDFSITSSSSGEILAAAVVPLKLTGEQYGEGNRKLRKCVGRSKGVEWGFTSVIGRRKEMEDAVAVVPGFMSRTCDHVGGCTTPGSRSSGEISPVHFFGVYDGHGGSQIISMRFFIATIDTRHLSATV